MTDTFVGALFYLVEIGLVVGGSICVYYLLRPKPVVRRIWMNLRGHYPMKKIQPNWGNRCLLCGSPMRINQCPRCKVTRPAALDKVLYRYLTTNDGVLARSEVASGLHVSDHELSESIERLTQAGKITPVHETQGGLIS